MHARRKEVLVLANRIDVTADQSALIRLTAAVAAQPAGCVCTAGEGHQSRPDLHMRIGVEYVIAECECIYAVGVKFFSKRTWDGIVGHHQEGFDRKLRCAEKGDVS